MKLLRRQQGFTLLETVIALAIVGILTASIIAGSNSGTNADRFGSKVRLITATIRDAQTKAYTVQTGTCTAANQTILTDGRSACVWRGNDMHFTVNPAPDQPYNLSLINGGDISTYSGQYDPKQNLLGESVFRSYTFNNIELTGIDVTNSMGVVTSVSDVTLAFLAPDGKGYVCTGAGSACVPSAVNSSPFTDSTSKVTFHMQDVKNPALKIDVLYDPNNGSISTIQR